MQKENENENKNKNTGRRRPWSEWLPLPRALMPLIVEYKHCAQDASTEERFHEMFLELDHAIVVPFEPNVSISLHFGTTYIREALYNGTVAGKNSTQQWFEIHAPYRDEPQINCISRRMTEQELFCTPFCWKTTVC